MINALWITLIGMGLVFLAILLLWGLLALLVRLTNAPEPAADSSADESQAGPAEEALVDQESSAIPEGALILDRKRRAAAVGAAIALAMQKQPVQARTGEPTATVSAWQAVHRAGQLTQRANSSRKKVVR